MKTWADVPGWFDFADLYAAIVREARDGAHFVEVGAFYGRSTCYMASEIKASGKAVRFDVIDRWDDSAIRAGFEANLRDCGVRNYVLPWWGTWQEFAPRFRDGEIDFVFLDADHSYRETAAAISTWLAKVKPGGILAGHDYAPEFPGVIAAVRDFLPLASKWGRSFFWRVPA